MKSGNLILLALVAWIAYRAGQSNQLERLVQAYPGAASPGY